MMVFDKFWNHHLLLSRIYFGATEADVDVENIFYASLCLLNSR